MLPPVFKISRKFQVFSIELLQF